MLSICDARLVLLVPAVADGQREPLEHTVERDTSDWRLSAD